MTDLCINIQTLLHQYLFFAQNGTILKLLKQSQNMKGATFHGNHVTRIVHYLYWGPDKQRAGIYTFTLIQRGG